MPATDAPKRILIVDDEPDVVTLLTEILALDGYAIDSAADGAEALLLIGRHHYDAIICDVVMPTLDGFGLYRELQTLAPELCARLAFTAARFDAIDRVREAGLPMLAKPFDVEEVRRVVRELLGG